MSTTSTTNNLGLGIYHPNDITSYDVFNANMEKIDDAAIYQPSSENAVDHVTINLNPTTSFMIEPAQGTNDGQVGRAGVMTSMQASQLAALAEAYKNTTQGIVLYEDTASVNYIDLSEDARNYDHIKIIGEYQSEGSTSFKQSVSAEFYPNGEVNTFQLTATDLTTGSTPAIITHQDVWMLDEEGTELALVSAQKGVVSSSNSATTVTVTPDTTSIFTITRVVGYGKKA